MALKIALIMLLFGPTPTPLYDSAGGTKVVAEVPAKAVTGIKFSKECNKLLHIDCSCVESPCKMVGSDTWVAVGYKTATEQGSSCAPGWVELHDFANAVFLHEGDPPDKDLGMDGLVPWKQSCLEL